MHWNQSFADKVVPVSLLTVLIRPHHCRSGWKRIVVPDNAQGTTHELAEEYRGPDTAAKANNCDWGVVESLSKHLHHNENVRVAARELLLVSPPNIICQLPMVHCAGTRQVQVTPCFSKVRGMSSVLGNDHPLHSALSLTTNIERMQELRHVLQDPAVWIIRRLGKRTGDWSLDHFAAGNP